VKLLKTSNARRSSGMARLRRTMALALVVTVAGAAAVGCQSSNKRLGLFPPNTRLVGQETIDRIKPGETRADWVEAVLGAPTETERLFDQSQEIWKYRYQLVGGGSYRLHARSDSGGTVRTIYIQMAGGTVTDTWMD
jgi:outer membrane protein assembly factor BamE (lipoprotein component of BamABCDE complex)